MIRLFSVCFQFLMTFSIVFRKTVKNKMEVRTWGMFYLQNILLMQNITVILSSWCCVPVSPRQHNQAPYLHCRSKTQSKTHPSLLIGQWRSSSRARIHYTAFSSGSKFTAVKRDWFRVLTLHLPIWVLLGRELLQVDINILFHSYINCNYIMLFNV